MQLEIYVMNKEYRVAKKTVALVQIYENLTIKAKNIEEAQDLAKEKDINLKKSKIQIASVQDINIFVY